MTRNRIEQQTYAPDHAAEARQLSELYGFPIEVRGDILPAAEPKVEPAIEAMREAASKEASVKLETTRQALQEEIKRKPKGKTHQTNETIPVGKFDGNLKVSPTYRPLPDSPLSQILGKYDAPDDYTAILARRVGKLAGTNHLPFERIERTIETFKRGEGVNWDGVVGSLAVSVNRSYRRMRGVSR